MTDVDDARDTSNFDPNLGGFVTAIATSYQSDFKQKCFSRHDAYGDKDDDVKASDENKELDLDGYNKPRARSPARFPSMSRFISLFHTGGSAPTSFAY